MKESLYESSKVIVDPKVVAALVELSSSSNIETRATCAASLGFAHVDEARAAEAVGRLAADPEKRIQVLAAKSLGLLVARTPAAVPPLLRHVFASEDEYVLRGALETLSLGGCKDPEVAAHLGAFAQRKRRGRSLFGRPALRDMPSGWSVDWISSLACTALCAFPGPLRVPLLLEVVRAHPRERQWEMRRRALASILTHLPGGGETGGFILETLLKAGARRVDDEFPDMPQWAIEESAEAESSELLRMLLQGPTPPEPLFRALAGVRRPTLAPFLPRLRELLGATRLPPEILSTVKRGLSSQDALVRANSATLMMCLVGPSESEAVTAAQLEDPEPSVRATAAGTLATLEALAPETLAALTRLARAHPLGVDGFRARGALARHDAPIPLPPDGVDTRAAVLGLVPIDFSVASGARLGEDGALYVPWKRVVNPAPQGKWSTDEDAFGIARVRLTAEGPRVESFPVAAPFPQAPTGGQDKRWLQLASRLGEDFVCVLRRPFSEAGRGWGTLNFLLLFTPATNSWSQLVPGEGESLRRVAIDAKLEEYERAVGGGELIVWVDGKGQLRWYVDGTPYHLEDSQPSAKVKAAYAERRRAEEPATRAHELSVDGYDAAAREPWVVKAPGDDTFPTLRLFNARLAVGAHPPELRAEPVDWVRCHGAHRLKDAAGRPQLVLFVHAQGSRGHAQAVLVLELAKMIGKPA
jgi:hypothetical protein